MTKARRISHVACTSAPGIAVAVLLCACSSLGYSEVEPEPTVRGPIPYRVEHPLAWTLLSMRLRRARVEPHGDLGIELDSAYTSVFRNDSTPTSNVTLDGELWSNSLRMRVGVVSGGDFEIEIPVLYASSGFLDTFVDAWHEFLHFADGGRDDRPKNDYEMTISSNGNEVYHLEPNEWMLGDIPVTWTQQILDESVYPISFAVRGSLQFPTGSESRGTSNGEIDWGVGLLAERSLSRWTLFGGVDFTSSGTSDAFADADVEIVEQIQFSVGAEFRWNDHLSWLGDLVYTSPMTDDFDLDVINREILDLGLGAAWSFSESSRLSISFHEDVISRAGSDFGVLLAWSWKL